MFSFIHRNQRILLFGFTAAFFTAPGQTFLVSLFIPDLTEVLSVDQTRISALYSFATLISACVLPLNGKLLDKLPLRRFAVYAGIGLVSGCLLLSFSHTVIGVFTGFFLIRNMGQGTLGMVSSTTMAKLFNQSRGKAIGIANLGYPFSEAVLPVLIASVNTHFDWRYGLMTLAVLTVFVFIPGTCFLVKSTIEVHEDKRILNSEIISHFSPKQVLTDWRFYFLAPAAVIYACYLTALFFHQISLISLRGWSPGLIPASFIIYGIFRAPASFFAGPLIDRYGARRIFPLTVLPMIAGLTVFITAPSEKWIFIYMALLGSGVGFSMTTGSAMWAEIYGTKYLGSIKGMMSSVMVLSTAASPVVFGFLIDRDIGYRSFVGYMILIAVLVTAGAFTACSKPKVRSVSETS